jgi:cytosine/adenosine deaminase-related metal-dependent hydrolase
MMERGMEPHRAVAFVTLNAARVLGRDAELGSIEVGKKADLAAFHTRGKHAFVKAAWVDGRLKLQLGLPAPEAVAAPVPLVAAEAP